VKTIWLLLILPFFGASNLSGQSFYLSSNPNLESMIPEDLPSGLDFDGLFKAGVTFTDQGGINYFFVTETWNRKHTRNKLNFYLASLKKKVARVNWKLEEWAEKGCRAEFVDHSLRVLDLDGDGYMETSFMYRFPCEDAREAPVRMLFNSRGDRLASWADVPEFGGNEIEVNYTDNYRSAPPIYRWFTKKTWKDLNYNGKIDYDPSWYVFLKESRILINRSLSSQTGNFFDWVDEKGKSIYLSDELSDLVVSAKDFKLLENGESLLILHEQALGILNLRNRKFNAWIDFYDYTFLLNSWAWTEDKSRFAFSTYNSVQYPEKTQIFVVDMDGAQMVGKQKFDLALDYVLGDIISGPALDWKGNYELRYVPRRGEKQQFEPEPIMLKLEK